MRACLERRQGNVVIFCIVCTATLPEDSHIRWIRFTSLHSFSRCLKCNVMTCRAERIFQSSSQKKKEGNRDIYIYIKALDAICTDVFWMGGFTEQSIPSASHTWADVRGEVLLRPSHVRRDC